MTKGLVSSMLVMMLRRLIIAAVGKPVGPKAKWSDNVNVGGGDIYVRCPEQNVTSENIGLCSMRNK